MKLPTEPDLWVYTTQRADDGTLVMVGDLEVTTVRDPLDHRITVTFKATVPDDLDLSQGFHRDLSVLLLSRCPRRPE